MRYQGSAGGSRPSQGLGKLAWRQDRGDRGADAPRAWRGSLKLARSLLEKYQSLASDGRPE